jgi:hypothetical protein
MQWHCISGWMLLQANLYNTEGENGEYHVEESHGNDYVG